MQKQVSEQQIVQMAQQEENVLKSKKNFLGKVVSILTDSERTIASLKEIQKTPKTMYINLGSGVLIEVETKNTKTCKRAFAENGYLEENITGTINWLEKKKDNSKTQLEKIEQDVRISEKRLNELVGILRQIEGQKRKEFNISKK